ncbi:MAG: Uma2 family endonuclease [Bacteroidia bacterium]
MKEYWIVNPDKKSVLIHKLNNLNTYFPGKEFNKGHVVSPELFPDLKIDLKEVFAE